MRNIVTFIGMIVIFVGCFFVVRSYNADDLVKALAKTEVEKSEVALLKDAVEQMSNLQKQLALAEKQASALAEKQASAPAEKQASAPAEKQVLSVSYVQTAKQQFSDLVPVYSGNETENPTGFGKTLATGLTRANNESHEGVRLAKVAAVNLLQEAHTRAVLDQDTLHIPEYTALLNQLNQETQNAQVLETVQWERLADEQAVEALTNPSFWQTLKWWWSE